jgi:hypothetical protein
MQLRRSVVGMLIAGVLTLASASLAQAQQAAENDTSAIETLGGFVATGVSAVTTFAEKGGVAADVTRNDFRGSGGTRNRLKNLWNARIEGWHGLSERIGKTLPYRLAPQLFQASDVLSSVVDPLLVGDGRGAVSGAVDLAATTAVASAGAAGGEVIGGALGGAAGSSVPVVGNVIGRMVGGAIGNFAGGYLAPAAYNFYLKSSVTQAVEAGIAFIVDPDPLMDMIQARQQALYQQLAPEVAEMIATSQSFGGGEVQILDWQHLVTANPPAAITPPQQQAGLPPATALPPMTHFQIEVQDRGIVIDDCRVDGTDVRCATRMERPPSWMRSYSGSTIGRLVGATLTGTLTAHIVTNSTADTACIWTEDYKGPITYVFSPDGTGKMRSGPHQRQSRGSGSCPGGNSGSTGSGEGTFQWRVLE